MADNTISHEIFLFRQHMIALCRYWARGRFIRVRIVLNRRHIPLLLELYCGNTYRTQKEIDDMRDSLMRGEGKWMGIPITIEP